MNFESHLRIASSSAGRQQRPRPSRSRKRETTQHHRKVVLGYKQVAALCVFLLIFFFLSWRIVQISVAQSLVASGEPDIALEWQASNVLAADALAQRELSTGGRLSGATREGLIAALKSSPLDDRAIGLIGLDTDRENNHALASRLMHVAGRRSWRSPIVQAWLFSYELGQKRYTAALEHLDALLRLTEDQPGPFFPIAASFTSQRDASAALSEYLGRSPPWRTWLLENLAVRLRSRENLIRVFEDLQRTAAPPIEAETASLLDRLIKDHEYILAREIAGKLQAGSRSDAWLYNADFSRPPNGSPFNWRMADRPGVDVGIVKNPDGTNALRLDFAGRVPLVDVRQIIMLPPGGWSLSGKLRASGLQSDMGVGWRIACAENDRPLTQPELEVGNFDWRQFSVSFRVPEEGCQAQQLTIVHPARVASEEVIRGQVWYRDLQITHTSDRNTQ